VFAERSSAGILLVNRIFETWWWHFCEVQVQSLRNTRKQRGHRTGLYQGPRLVCCDGGMER